MRRSSLAALCTAALLAAPALASAQESQPFTNTSDEGVRVVPADDSRGTGVPAAVRADGDFASGKLQLLPASGATGSRSLSASQMRGRLAGSYSPADHITVFGSLFSAVTSYSGLDLAAARGANSISQYTNRNPLTNYGDFVAGARYTGEAAEGINWGAEGGFYFFGQANGLFSGPALDATSPFARGLVTWTGGAIRVSGNLGASYDQSWKVWQEAFNASCTPTATTHCLSSPTDGTTTVGATRSVDAIDPEERFMLGIYGKNGPVVRILGGALASIELGPARPFLETSFESNGGATTAHLSPGIAFAPEGLPHFVLAADIAPIAQKATDPAPGALAAGVHAAIVYDFGGPRTHSVHGGTGTHSRHAPLVVEVVTDRGEAVPGVRVVVRDNSRNTHVLAQASDLEGKIRDNDISPSQVNSVRAERPDLLSYPLVPGPTAIRALAVPRSSTAPVTIQFHDDLRVVPVSVEVVWGKSSGPLRWPRTMPPQQNAFIESVPATPDQGWRVVVTQTVTGAEWHVDVTQPGVAINRHLYWDAAAKTWSEVPPRPVEVGVVVPNVFDPELAEVHGAALAAIIERLQKDPSAKAQFFVTLKPGGDPTFTEILLKARAEALAAHLKSRNVRESQYSIATPHGSDDAVRVEIGK